LPTNFSNKMLITFIKDNFKVIRNIKVLRRSQKKETLSLFLSTIKYYVSVKIYFLMLTAQKQQEASIDNDCIIMPKQTEES
jgi:hypothetical protein